MINENISPVSDSNSNTIDYTRELLISSHIRNKAYSNALKERLKTLIKDREMKESDFYRSIGISRNYWYLISYGKQECPLELKIKIGRALNTDSALIWRDGNQ